MTVQFDLFDDTQNDILGAKDYQQFSSSLKESHCKKCELHKGRRNIETGNLLTKGGVAVAYDPLAITTHTKLLIIDGKISIVGSTNWTYNALDKNHEASVLIQSSEVASNLQDYFQSVWKSCSKSK